MPEALARIRREPTLSAPVREPARPAPRTAKAAPRPKWRIWAPRTSGSYAAIFMAMASLGIVINAVGLQHERHPAPLFAPDAAPAPAQAQAAPAQAQAAPAPPAPAPSPAVAATEGATPPAAKPAVTVPPPPPAPPRKTDPIGDLVRSGTASETGKTVLVVQRSLIKLGYDLQADGVLGATTLDALRDFEKTHGLPATNELSPRLIAKLTGAAR